MRNSKLVGGVVVGTLALALTACSSVGNNTAGTTAAGSATSAAPADTAPATQAAPAGKGGAYVVVVKATGIGWFDRMKVGVDEWAKETGIDAREEGPSQATNEGQVAIIQDLIAQKPTAITVVPNDLAGLETVLGRAKAAGIITVGHEAVGMKNVDADIEGFVNSAYGAKIMDNLGECMGGTGKYVQFVGALTTGSHMEWVNSALAQQKAKFPDMQRVEDPIESQENEDTAYNKAKEILQKYPEIKGFEGSAGTDVVGIARAVEEAGKAGTTCVMGTSIPSVAGSYLTSGAIDKIFFWDPALAGKAQLAIAKILAEGGTITEGMDLGIPGYNSLKKLPDPTGVAWAGDAALAVDATNAGDYKF